MRTLIVIVFVFLFFSGGAQQSAIIVQGSGPGMSVAHIVLPKESLYSVARLYNIAPAVLASANEISLQTGLKIGETLKVPLTDQNFDQQVKKAADETLVPIYHVVAKSETLFRIANNYNKVPLDYLKDWNRLSGDNITAGTPLVIGYLKIKNEQVASLKTGVPALANDTDAPVDKAMPTATQTPVSEPMSASPKPATREIEKETITNKPVANEIKADQDPVSMQPATTPATDKPVFVEETKTEPVAQKPASQKPVVQHVSNSDEGFFGNVFAADSEGRNIIENNGEAGTFKSTSGWQNKKYYALINNVTPGTILKITADKKTIYAKVLGSLPEMKENNNLVLRLSNAAASTLQKVDPKFMVEISYYQ